VASTTKTPFPAAMADIAANRIASIAFTPILKHLIIHYPFQLIVVKFPLRVPVLLYLLL
jgi:hypothetical protein